MTVPPQLEHVLARLRALKDLQRAQTDLHKPSAIEEWLLVDSPLFWDPKRLERFRSPSDHLHSGTMDWPNRRPRHAKWVYENNRLQQQPDSARSLGVLQRCADAVESLKGYVHLWRLDRALAHELPASVRLRLSDISVGRPFGLRTMSGRLLTEPVLRHGFYLGRLLRHLPAQFWDGGSVLEIGAGYGGLARVLKSHAPALRITLVDLPERLALQAYFLCQAFPQATVEVVDGAWSWGQSTPDFVLVPTWEVPAIPDAAIGLVINTHSLQEMTAAQVSYYLEHVHRVGRSFFYCVNRYEKQIGQEMICHPSPRLQGQWDVVIEEPEQNYPRVLEGLYRRHTTTIGEPRSTIPHEASHP